MISSLEPGLAGQPRGALRRGWLRGGRWLLPWLAVLLVSVSLASAVHHALTGAWVPITARSALSPTPAVAELRQLARSGTVLTLGRSIVRALHGSPLTARR
jgi:hypothetical protein